MRVNQNELRVKFRNQIRENVTHNFNVIRKILRMSEKEFTQYLGTTKQTLYNIKKGIYYNQGNENRTNNILIGILSLMDGYLRQNPYDMDVYRKLNQIFYKNLYEESKDFIENIRIRSWLNHELNINDFFPEGIEGHSGEDLKISYVNKWYSLYFEPIADTDSIKFDIESIVKFNHLFITYEFLKEENIALLGCLLKYMERYDKKFMISRSITEWLLELSIESDSEKRLVAQEKYEILKYLRENNFLQYIDYGLSQGYLYQEKLGINRYVQDNNIINAMILIDSTQDDAFLYSKGQDKQIYYLVNNEANYSYRIKDNSYMPLAEVNYKSDAE